MIDVDPSVLKKKLDVDPRFRVIEVGGGAVYVLSNFFFYICMHGSS